ncbi:MAG: TolB family protein, partial [Halobacteriaceae archaeon]
MERIEASDYHDIAKLSDPQVSPSSDRVAYVQSQPDGDDEYESTIHVAQIGGDEPQRFTAVEGSDSQPRWSPDGQTLAFVSADRGEDDPSAQLWLLPTGGGEAKRVTNVVGSISGVTWSPDGSKIAFTQSTTEKEREEGHDIDVDEDYEREDPDPRVIDRLIYRQNASYNDGKRSHVYTYDIDSEEISRLTEGNRDFVGVEWGNNDELYYAVKRGEMPDDSYEYDVDKYDIEDDAANT